MIAALFSAIGGRGVLYLAAAGVAVALVIGIYQTGVSAERKRGEAAQLRATINLMREQQQTALDIQTRMAERMAELRAGMERQETETNALIEQIRREPRAGACVLSDRQRMRLNAIRIGPAANSRR